MSIPKPVMDQHLGAAIDVGNSYLTIDGVIKHCITAPLLELPIDFKEWYKPARAANCPVSSAPRRNNCQS